MSKDYANPISTGTIPTDSERELLASGDARYLSTDAATGFPVYFGCYATGNGSECEQRAHFTDFADRPIGE